MAHIADIPTAYNYGMQTFDFDHAVETLKGGRAIRIHGFKDDECNKYLKICREIASQAGLIEVNNLDPDDNDTCRIGIVPSRYEGMWVANIARTY